MVARLRNAFKALGIAGGFLFMALAVFDKFVPQIGSDTLVVPNSFSVGQVADPAKVNANFDSIRSIVNGKLDNNNWDTAGPDLDYSNMALASKIVSGDLVDGTVAVADLAPNMPQTILAKDAIVQTGAAYTMDRLGTVRLRASVTPAETVDIGAGLLVFGSTNVYYAGATGTAPPAKPAVAGHSRKDLASLTIAGALVWTQGVDVVGDAALEPLVPVGNIGLGVVHRRNSETVIKDTDDGSSNGFVFKDLRPIMASASIVNHVVTAAGNGGGTCDSTWQDVSLTTVTPILRGGRVTAKYNFSWRGAGDYIDKVKVRIVIGTTNGLEHFIHGENTSGQVVGHSAGATAIGFVGATTIKLQVNCDRSLAGGSFDMEPSPYIEVIEYS